MSRLYAALLLLTCLPCQRIVAADDVKPSDLIPELAVLDHYAGSWDSETASNVPFTKGKVTAKWVLGGRFLQQEAEATDAPTEFKYMSLMTYDPAKKVYRTWIFLSDGSALESEGTWNAKEQVMTSVGPKDENGGFSTTTADFSESDVEKWKIVYRDRDDKVVGEISGKNIRHKK
jgi:hypothetical protein